MTKEPAVRLCLCALPGSWLSPLTPDEPARRRMAVVLLSILALLSSLPGAFGDKNVANTNYDQAPSFLGPAFYSLRTSEVHATFWRNQFHRELVPPTHKIAQDFRLRVMAFGDSTARNPFHFFIDVMSETFQRNNGSLSKSHETIVNDTLFNGAVEVQISWSFQPMNTAIKYVSHVDQRLEQLNLDSPTNTSTGEPQQRRRRGAATANSEGRDKQSADKPIVKVVMFNGYALHLMHLLPARDWSIEGFLNYEKRLRYVLEKLSDREDIDKIIFMTTHWVCDRKYKDIYAKLSRQYHVRDPDVLEECRKHALAKAAKFKIDLTKRSEQELDDLCMNGLITSYGTSAIYDLEMSILADFPNVAVLNSHKMVKEQCWATRPGDGRHYFPFLPTRAARMVEVISGVLRDRNVVVMKDSDDER